MDFRSRFNPERQAIETRTNDLMPELKGPLVGGMAKGFEDARIFLCGRLEIRA